MGIYGAGRAVQQQQQRIDPPVQNNPWTPPSISQVGHISGHYEPWTGTPPIDVSQSQGPVYTPDDQTAYQAESNTVAYMGPRSNMQPFGNVPKPLTTPMFSPVSELKNRTALSMDYSPEASRILYDTPTRVRFGDFDTHTSDTQNIPLGSQGVGGSYHSPRWHPNDYEIYVNGGGRDHQRDILQHEFTHKWFDQMPPLNNADWMHNSFKLSNPDAIKRASSEIYGGMPNPNELYAYNLSGGMYGLDDEMRNQYYAGLFEGDSKEWPEVKYLPLPAGFFGGLQDFGPPNWRQPPVSDRLRERAPWTLENGALG